MKRIIVSGALANKPYNGGNAWSRLSWILGFKRLGFEVCFAEQIDLDNCVDFSGTATDFANSANLSFFKAVMTQFGLERSCTLICNDGHAWGFSLADLMAGVRNADALFNFSGHLNLPELKNAPACKVYYDDDPGFTQFWYAAGSNGARLSGHDFHFTIGENIGSSDCDIPTGEIRWRHTRPPVGLDDWPVCAPRAFDRFTTIASWRGAYGAITHTGKTYGLKCHEFRKFLALPQRVKQKFEVALQIHPSDKKDLDALQEQDWQIIEPKTVASSPNDFRRYVQNSAAEFSPAQGIYVDTNSGWFSDRTVRYLASGRPALVQETGFSRHIKTGAGLISFRNLDEAVAGAEMISRDYQFHCAAAREIAEEYFDADKIIRRLVSEIGLSLP